MRNPFCLLLFLFAVNTYASIEKEFELEQSFFTKILSEEKKRNLTRLVADNPYADMSPQELKGLIQSASNPAVRQFLGDDSKLLNFLVDFLRDDKALPGLIGILNRGDELKRYGVIALVVTLLSFIFQLSLSKGNIFKRMLIKFIFSIGVLAINLGVFWVQFRSELGPTLEIIRTHL